MNRYRVTGGNFDLLRTKASARAAIAAQMDAHDGYYWRKTKGPVKGPLHGPMPKSEVLKAFEYWGGLMPGFSIGRMKQGKFTLHVRVALENVTLIKLDNCSPETSEVYSLVKHQFPNVVFAGGYVYKNPGGYWSDHAWGTAFDVHPVDNDAVFAWLVSMAIADCLRFDYIIGSRNGTVVSARMDHGYVVVVGGGDSTHLWHVHVSIEDHDGRKPPREGGAW